MASPAATSSDYGRMAAQLARQALGAARDAAPHRPRSDRWQCSLVVGVPAARLLAGVTDQTAQDRAGLAEGLEQLASASDASQAGGSPHFSDGFGHSRGVYTLLMLHLHLAALETTQSALTLEQLRTCRSLAERCAPLIDNHGSAGCDGDRNDDLSLRLWRALVGLELTCVLNHAEPEHRYARQVAELLERSNSRDSLWPRDSDDAIDDWTYRELVGLHALDRLATVTARDDWRQRAHQVAAFHEGHTQPDYITYQPWALAAFARRQETVMFAQQQLHDVTVHLSTGGPAAALVPGLLLADAAAALRGDGA